MNIMTREFHFKDRESTIEGVFFYNADIVSEEVAVNTINKCGVEMDNQILKPDAPCFFLPKSKADLLQNWVKQRINEAVEEALTDKNREMENR